MTFTYDPHPGLVRMGGDVEESLRVAPRITHRIEVTWFQRAYEMDR